MQSHLNATPLLAHRKYPVFPDYELTLSLQGEIVLESLVLWMVISIKVQRILFERLLECTVLLRSHPPPRGPYQDKDRRKIIIDGANGFRTTDALSFLDAAKFDFLGG